MQMQGTDATRAALRFGGRGMSPASGGNGRKCSAKRSLGVCKITSQAAGGKIEIDTLPIMQAQNFETKKAKPNVPGLPLHVMSTIVGQQIRVSIITVW